MSNRLILRTVFGLTCIALSYQPVRGQCPSQWLPGDVSGPNGHIRALILLPNGDLVAGGEFTTIGGVGANRIARWDGEVWSPIGTGMANPPGELYTWVNALAVLPNGD